MPFHLGLPHSHSREQQEASREARRQLQEKVRNDWDYPDAPHPDTHQSAIVQRSAKESIGSLAQQHPLAIAQQSATLDCEPRAWREREYSDMGSSGEDDDLPTARRQQQQYRFDSPDTVGKVVSADKKALKRKRQEDLEEEMTWNIGLAHFGARRNAWTGARGEAVVATEAANAAESTINGTGDGTTHIDSSTSSSSTSDNTTTPHTNDLNEGPSARPTTSSLPGPEDATVLIPVIPRLLPDHPVRARISTSTYSEIYTKVILQGRTPTVPVNLQDVTNALIHGWKEEGNWPPKVGPPEPSLGKKKATSSGAGTAAAGHGHGHPNLKKGVHAVGKALGF